MNFKVGDKVVAVEDEYAAYENWVEMAAGDTGTIISLDGEYFVSVELDEQDVPENERTWCSVAESKLELVDSPDAYTRLLEYYKSGIEEEDKNIYDSHTAKEYYKQKIQEMGGYKVSTGEPAALYLNTWDAYNDTIR